MRALHHAAVSALLLQSLLLAGPSLAGEAWQAEYEIRDRDGRHALTVVRDERRVEYREGDPAMHRQWRLREDGIERIEFFPASRAAVVASPGELRTLGEEPAWATLTGIVPASLREGLKPAGRLERFAQPGTRLAGHDAQGRKIVLEWLDGIGLPASGRIGEGHDRYQLTLRSLRRVDAGENFTATSGLRSYDRADLGDMALDPFAREYLARAGASRHAH
ncbi:hypothetical protein FZO89_11165 [Luteimonas viscosa]|uniref:Outer membrane lipoprotein-sorting protein n=1 Tax=Luteimonas viscosa TaxID=1132694 RepID=A0A5D4XS52_9GAMM|nr:hypothetical protein [Luteimonas viscosa]TYT26773.1 hypothetical protein FZO89_11165 [Luteimonas viscosa]